MYDIMIPYEILGSVLMPNDPISCLTFGRMLWAIVMYGILMARNLKTGHYIKVPPRHIFLAIVAAIIVQALTVHFTSIYIFSHVPDLCMISNSTWSCNSFVKAFSNAALWSNIGE